MKENNAEDNIMLCKTGMHPSCDHGIQFWSKDPKLERKLPHLKSVEMAKQKLLKAKPSFFMNRDKKGTE